MYLFTRGGRFAPGSIREAMAFVGTMTDKVHQETGLDIHAWAATMSPDLGATVWATFVEDLGQLEEAQDKLQVSEGFLALAEEHASLFAGPLTDGLAQVAYGERDPSAPLPAYVTSARATAANGKLGKAMSDGVEIAETATRLTGVPTMFLVDVTGHYGGCRWSTGFDSIASLQRAGTQLQTDETWVALIDRVGPSFAPGASTSIYRRIV